jgi:VWFA-related protein
MKPSRLALVLLSAACACALQGQQAQPPTNHVALHVAALDSAGNPVPDLTASDFKVFDNGSPQKVVSVQPNPAGGPPALVILFDLVNSNLSSRGEIASIVKTSLPRLPDAGPLYLYLLVENGSLYPVHGLPANGAGLQPVDDSWVQNVVPLLNDALNKTVQLKPQDLRAGSPIALPARFRATCSALDDLRARMAVLPGSKDLLWVTYGFPSAIRMVGNGWWDGGPSLRQLGARFVQSGVTIYTADPGLNLNRGMLDRDALDILTGATGGRAFPTANLTLAITQAQAAAHSSYNLEFQPAPRNWDGKYHKVRVTVARKGVHLQSESGYYAIL